MTHLFDAVIVGAGPNGLTAAARLAVAGRSVLVIEAGPTIGGGSRTKPLLDSGAVYDVCAAVHPFGVSSPAFAELRLHEHGLQWLHPEIGLAHPFDDGTAAALYRSVSSSPTTADGLGVDAAQWRRLVGFMASDWDRWRKFAMAGVVTNLVHHPIDMVRFGALAGMPATVAARLFHSREARALITGMAAHSGASLRQPATSGVAFSLAAASESAGMPFAAGGSQSIVDALASVITRAGGLIETGRLITSLRDLPSSRAVLLDVTPGQAAGIVGVPSATWKHGVAATWKHGVAACKIDMVLSGPMPWTAPQCRAAGTVHLGGEWRDIAAAEGRTAKGELPDNPYVIVTQPSLVDASRAPTGQYVVWAYRHVPNGCTSTEAAKGIERQLDRFAPGWRDLVLHKRVTNALDYEAYNPGYIGGDIAGGAMTLKQMIARPRLALDPYRTRHDGVWLCSQSTAPGPGVHGMCGWHAAASVLKHQPD